MKWFCKIRYLYVTENSWVLKEGCNILDFKPLIKYLRKNNSIMNTQKTTKKESFKTKFLKFYHCEVRTFNRILGIK